MREMSDKAVEDVAEGDVMVFKCKGCLNRFFAHELMNITENNLNKSFRKFVIDMSESSLIESPGVAGLLSVVELIVDENHGVVVFCNLKPTHKKVLEMVGVFMYASLCETRKEALSEVNAA